CRSVSEPEFRISAPHAALRCRELRGVRVRGLPLPDRWLGACSTLPGNAVLSSGARPGNARALAHVLSDRGAVLVLVDIDADAAERTARELGTTAFGIGADVADRAQMRAAVAAVLDRFGRLDVVVANAGVTPVPATVRTMDPADFD